MRARLRRDRGQGALELIVVLALIGLLVLAATTSPLVGRAGSAITQAVCRLFTAPDSGGGDCAGGFAPLPPTGEPQWACVRSSVGGNGKVGVTVAFVDLGGGEGFLLEELSDGTWRVTWAEEGELGVSGALFEGGAAVRVGGREVGLHAELRAEAALTGRESDSRVFRSEDDAYDYLRERLADEGIEHLPHGPRQIAGVFNGLFGPDGPDGEEGPATAETGVRIQGGASGAAGPLSGELEAIGRAGARITALPDGSQIVTVLMQGEAGATAGVPVVAELGARGARQYLVSLRVDPDGDPVALRVTAEASGTVRPGLVHERTPTRGLLEQLKGAIRDSDTDRTVIDYELALDTPERRAAALSFLADSPRPGEDAGDLDALAATAEELWGDHGQGVTIAMRQYHDSETAVGVEAKLRALGIVGAGVEGEVNVTTQQLQEALYWDTTNGGFVPWSRCSG